MDERELEARLGARLHRRFDRRAPSAAFRERVLDVIRSDASRPSRTLRSFWPLAAAAVLVVAFVGVALRFGIPGPTTPQGPVASLAPATPVPGTTIVYRVLPMNGALPDVEGVEATRRVLEKRLAATGAAGYSVQAQGTDELVVTLPGVWDAEAFKTLLGTTGKVEFIPLPAAEYGTVESPGARQAVDGQPLPTTETPLFDGSQIDEAYPATDAAGNAVGFRLKPDGARLFAEYTTNHVNEFFAIVLDNMVVSAPYIASPIAGGSGEISGGSKGFTATEMNSLITVLNYGALPFPLEAVSEISPPGTPPPGTPPPGTPPGTPSPGTPPPGTPPGTPSPGTPPPGTPPGTPSPGTPPPGTPPGTPSPGTPPPGMPPGTPSPAVSPSQGVVLSVEIGGQ